MRAVSEIKAALETGAVGSVTPGRDVNNHVHTAYSFSPYSPAGAVWKAYESGLKTVGIVDHDSVSGAGEFRAAARAIGIMCTVGLECRVDMSATPLAGRRFNSPDQKGIAYVVLHGIAPGSIAAVDDFLAPIRAARGLHNREMVARLNEITEPHGLGLDYESDILPLSHTREGGSVTERHILFALARRMVGRYGRGDALIRFLTEDMGLPPAGKPKEWLSDPENPYYEYDLMGVLKSGLVERFYTPAVRECPPVADFIALAGRTGAIPAYSYLGDVGDSVTGDKKALQFEDGYLDALFPVIADLGFRAVTYMPSRNTPAQLRRVRALCGQFGLLQISGEDINSPRQSFVSYAQRGPEFADLYDTALALIGHERMLETDSGEGMFSPGAVARYPSLGERVRVFRDLALAENHCFS
jgi:hypothetical protein